MTAWNGDARWEIWYHEMTLDIRRTPLKFQPRPGTLFTRRAKKPIKMQLKAGYIARDIRRRVAHKYYSCQKVALTKSQQQPGEINAASRM